MKPTRNLLSYACCLATLSLSAAVPLRWTVETSRAQPAQFEAYQGETIALEASLQSDGKPLEAPLNYSFYWQTNGMGNAYWEAPTQGGSGVSPLEGRTNVLFATWLPAYDVGARVYNCFIGQPGTIYHAAFQLRLRPSPGATPNVLPLPTPVIDFAKVTVLNPPWPTKTVDGSARALPKYLHEANFADSYPEEAAAYYASRGDGKVDGGCSSVRDGGFLYRNFDFPFDDRAEFVVHMSSGPARFASVGVAQVGTNITETMATSGKPLPPRFYKALPGATVDGINEHGVVAEINVVDGNPQTSGWHTNATSEAIHPLGAIRWILDHATNAQHAATFLAANIRFPAGWTQNFHYMIADETNTYIVENGAALDADEFHEPDEPATMTNFPLNRFPWEGMGMERFGLLLGGEPITNAWFTRAYSRSTNPPWVSDLRDVLAYTNDIFYAWASHPKEYFRNKTTNGQPWWQTIHTSIYDITNRILRVAVQETDDFYTFKVPASGGGTDEAKVREIAGEIVAPVASQVSTLSSSVSSLQSSKADKSTTYTKADTDSKLAGKQDIITVMFPLSLEAMNYKWLDSDGNPVCYTKYYDIMEGWGTPAYEDEQCTLPYKGGGWTVEVPFGQGQQVYRLYNTMTGWGDYLLDTPDMVGFELSVDLSSKADRSELPTTPGEVGAYPAASGQQLAGQVGTIGAHLNAEDARFVSTNYNSATHMPEAYVEIKLPDQTWAVIWREMTRWNWFFDEWLPAHLYTKSQVDAMLAEKADRAWGYYDSHSGTYAPDGYTWISSPKVALAAGLGYQRTATVEGAIWVLESNGLVTETGGVASNGFFRISDDEGNVQFEIVKGNKRTIGADASSCKTVSGFALTKLQIGYSVVSDAHPTLRICGDLTTHQWKDETDPDCLANVTWEGSPGAWVAYVQGKTAQPSLFVKATYEVGGETYIRNAAPVSMEYLYLGGVKYAVGTATISGHTVLTLTPAN